MSMNRITFDALDYLVCRINGECIGYMTSNPHGFEDPKRRVGMYVISGAYGGWELQRIVNESGGAESVFGCGHVSKRDLHGRLMAFLDGIHAGRKADRARAEDEHEARERAAVRAVVDRRTEAFLNRPRA